MEINLHFSSAFSRVNPSDCVDMDCDGLKKAFLVDKDGSLFGQRSTVLAYSEFAWGTDPRRGTGDYRIPYTMITNTDGLRLDIDGFATHVERGKLLHHLTSFQTVPMY